MKHSRPSIVASEMEPQPPAGPDVDESPVQRVVGVGVHGHVVSAYEAHHAELFALLVRATRDEAVAEDLLREAYARLAIAARDGRAPVEVRGWLFRVASGLVIASANGRPTTRGWLGRRGHADLDEPAASSTKAGVVGSERPEIERALAGLSTDARLALLLSGAGFSGEDIAAAIDRPVAATRTLLGRARARVRIRRDLFAREAR